MKDIRKIRLRRYGNGTTSLEESQYAFGNQQPTGGYSTPDKYPGATNLTNKVGSAVPIIGAFKAIGEGIDAGVSPKDQYGVRQGSDFAVGVGSNFNPKDAITSGLKGLSKGDFSGANMAKAFLPGIGGVVENNERKKEARKQKAIEQNAIAQSKIGDVDLDKFQYNINQNELGYAYGGIHGFQKGMPTAELEKGEPFRTPDGQIHQVPVGAPSHAQGGIAAIDTRTGQKVAEMEGDEPYMILSRDTYRNNKGVIDALLNSSMNQGCAPIMRNGGAFIPNASASSPISTVVVNSSSSTSTLNMDTSRLESKLDAILTAFEKFPRDFKGYITWQDLKDTTELVDQVKNKAFGS